jgi:hypothetical protein
MNLKKRGHVVRQANDKIAGAGGGASQIQTAKSLQPKSLVQFFRESPLGGVRLESERDKDTGRDVEL